MTTRRRPAPPSGMQPPARASIPGRALELDLSELAHCVCERYYEAYPDEDETYGPSGRLWCLHDNQHLLNWAALDVSGLADLEKQVAWLAKVLEAREFPLDRLARDLEIAAAVVQERVSAGEAMAARLRDAARMVAGRGTFL